MYQPELFRLFDFEGEVPGPWPDRRVLVTPRHWLLIKDSWRWGRKA